MWSTSRPMTCVSQRDCCARSGGDMAAMHSLRCRPLRLGADHTHFTPPSRSDGHSESPSSTMRMYVPPQCGSVYAPSCRSMFTLPPLVEIVVLSGNRSQHDFAYFAKHDNCVGEGD